MSRPLRIEFENASYHVMNRGLERREIFLDNNDRTYFLRLLEGSWERWKISIFAYCLMETHYHIFLKTPLGNLSRVMRHIDGLYTQYVNRARRRDGPLFRGRYKAVLVDADDYLLQVVRYIHLNPVKAGITPHPSDYPWSSHRLYLDASSQQPPWLNTGEVLSFFSGPDSFDAFVSHGNDRSLEEFYSRKHSGNMLAGEGFIQKALNRVQSAREHPRHDLTPQFPSLRELSLSIGRHTGVEMESLQIGCRGQENQARNMAVYIASRRTGFSHPEIRRFFNIGSDSAVAKICRRIEERLSRDSGLNDLLARVTGKGEMCQVKI